MTHRPHPPLTEQPPPALAGQVFLQDQGEVAGAGRRWVVVVGIVTVPAGVALDRQYDLTGHADADGALQMTLSHPHPWRDEDGDGFEGRGVTALLKAPAWRVEGDLIGLSSTLDRATAARLHRRNALYAKTPRNAEEDLELSRLSADLAALGFCAADFRDPAYVAFLRARARRDQPPPVLSAPAQAEVDAHADAIIDEILREEADRTPG